MTYQEIQNINALSQKAINELSYDEFLTVINFTSYDLMKQTLNGKNYRFKGDYEYLTTDQKEMMELIELTSENVDTFKSKTSQNLRLKLKELFPDHKNTVDYMYIDWNKTFNIYSTLVA